MTVGAVTGFVGTYAVLANRTARVSRMLNALEKAKVSWARLRRYLVPAEPVRPAVAPSAVPGHALVEFENVSLTGTGAPLFKNLTLALERGMTLGITGPVASGKSVLLRAMIKDMPYAGSIRLNGHEVRDLPQENVSGSVVYMGHDPELFSDTIAANVEMGDDFDAKPFLELVQFGKDLEDMPQGLQTMIGSGGVRLSGGQQERLALARTVAHARPVVLLDDPFASVDAATMAAIVPALAGVLGSAVTVITSHRLAFFPALDRVLYLDGRGGYAYGTHAELLASCRPYARLWAMQQKGASR